MVVGNKYSPTGTYTVYTRRPKWIPSVGGYNLATLCLRVKTLRPGPPAWGCACEQISLCNPAKQQPDTFTEVDKTNVQRTWHLDQKLQPVCIDESTQNAAQRSRYIQNRRHCYSGNEMHGRRNHSIQKPYHILQPS